MPIFTFALETSEGVRTADIAINTCVIAGWTGRDADAVEHHIRELEALGIPRPKTTPIFYRVAASRLTQAPSVEMSGEASSGEAEAMLVHHDGILWVGIGSDHTDRKAETHGITLSKQMCDKPIATTLWPLREVEAHWDELILESTITENGKDVLYQQGPLSALRHPDDLIARYTDGAGLDDGTAMFCGTHAAIGGIRPASPFKMSLRDPVRTRTITHRYATTTLPVEG